MARMTNRGHTRVKVLLNVGLGLDLITGSYIIGKYGEHILNGGLPQFLTVSGPTNNFKSFVSNHWNLTALNRTVASIPSYYNTYDAEVNTNIVVLDNWGKSFEYLNNNLLTGTDAHWEIDDASVKKADEWKADYVKFIGEQIKENKIKFDGYLDPYTHSTLELQPPTFYSLDTITALKTTTSDGNLEKYKKDDGSDNMEHMQLGKFKSNLLATVPDMLIRANSYITMVAQVAEGIDMGGMFSPKPMKKLQYLKDVDKIKGVPKEFYTLPGLGLLFHNAKNLHNSDRKDVFYPSKKKNYMVNDLNKVMCTVLRNKSGHDGITLTIIISKEDGILEGLTDFHTIKDKTIGDGYGMSGNAVNYHLDLYPDVTIGRTTVRDKIDEDKLLVKALEFTRDMFQLTLYKPQLLLDGLLCTPKELYDDIKALGYDWNMLLNTVSWYTPNHYTSERQFLTMRDLLDMRKETYHPYWLARDKKTILEAKDYEGNK